MRTTKIDSSHSPLQSKEMPIEKVKEALKNANLIKETTKAPESILRQMYSDYLLLKNRAL